MTVSVLHDVPCAKGEAKKALKSEYVIWPLRYCVQAVGEGVAVGGVPVTVFVGVFVVVRVGVAVLVDVLAGVGVLVDVLAGVLVGSQTLLVNTISSMYQPVAPIELSV